MRWTIYFLVLVTQIRYALLHCTNYTDIELELLSKFDVEADAVICRDMDLEDVLPIGPTFQQRIYDVVLFSVSGDIHLELLKLVSRPSSLIILQSNISSFALESDIVGLNVTESTFPKLTSEILKGCPYLLTIYLKSNPGLHLEGSPFKHQSNLVAILIINQTLPRIKRDFFQGPKNLSQILLFSDKIREVDEDAFVGLQDLENLFLDKNPIESFHVDLSSLTRLKRLSLTNTNLKEIDPNTLIPLKSLEEIGIPITLLTGTNITELVANLPNVYTICIVIKDQRCSQFYSREIKNLGDTYYHKE